jgi:hypothetical protein
LELLLSELLLPMPLLFELLELLELPDPLLLPAGPLELSLWLLLLLTLFVSLPDPLTLEPEEPCELLLEPRLPWPCEPLGWLDELLLGDELLPVPREPLGLDPELPLCELPL